VDAVAAPDGNVIPPLELKKAEIAIGHDRYDFIGSMIQNE
jgi:hypothetical protein